MTEPRAIGLLGSGEFEPWSEAVDRWLIEHSSLDSDRVLVLPTASAPEGDDIFDRWGRMGVDHYRRMGLDPEVIPLKTREDAERPDLAEKVAGAAEVFFSGGNPAHLVSVLEGSRFWTALTQAVEQGTALGGCSAGAVFLGESAPDSTRTDFGPDVFGPGLRYFPGVEFAPHWDALDRYVPGLSGFVRASLTPGAVHVLIDERTAIVGDGDRWTVMGSGTVTVSRNGEDRAFAPGEPFELPRVAPA